MNVIYGELDGGLIFLLEPDAEGLVAVRRAIHGSRTWGEFFDALPDAYRSEVRDILADDDIEIRNDDAFHPDEIPGYPDGDWPQWPAARMLEWMPEEIANEFGEHVGSAITGDSLQIAAHKEEDVVRALNAAGYSCHRDESMIRMVSGVQ
jgi:hypothetical protein